jgi:bifunctional UDP-N-acetylglucosamine pyrophosphorylase/glucosamine-1-phosphate N-acetyltransferase
LSYLIEEGKVYACVLSEAWIDIGRPWDLLEANEILMKGMDKGLVEGELEPHVTLKGAVHIGRGTVVRNGAYIIGPVIIGENCEIGPNCLIRPYTCIGNKCKVGNAVEIKNSIIMDETHVPHLNYVGDSILGSRCNLGAGTKVANLRLDNKNVKTVLKGEVVDSGRRKLGVIMGDDVKTGINASIDPGTVICEESFIGPGTIAKGFIAPKSRVH